MYKYSMRPYTYLIKHLPTGTVYYGVRTANKLPAQEDLWKVYFTSSKKIQELVAADGLEAFEVQIRREFETPDAAVAWETRVLQRAKVLADDRWLNANVAGHILATPAVRAKISAYHTGRPKTEEQRRKMSEALKGKPKDYCRTNEYRSNMSQIMTGQGNPNYGKKHSEETLAKISAAKKGSVPWNKGGTTSEERKQHQSRVMSGRKQDPEVVARRSETMRAKGMKRERLVCLHCAKEIPVNIYARYHGEKCKAKTDFS